MSTIRFVLIHPVWDNWEDYAKRFEFYLEMNKMSKEGRKKYSLLITLQFENFTKKDLLASESM